MDLKFTRSLVLICCTALLVGACSGLSSGGRSYSSVPTKAIALTDVQIAAAVDPTGVNGLVAKYAAIYGVPESLVHRIIVRESGYNARARNGPYYGLMQISYATAQTMGYRGAASGLLDPETNLKYGVKYLAGAYLVAGNSADGAVRNYSSGYYYDAKRQGLLEEVGLR